MREVSATLNESSSLAVLDGHDIVYVARVPTERIISIALNVGTRLPAYCTSMGRELLAQVRKRDYCIVNEELGIGLRSLAVPVRNRSGHVVDGNKRQHTRAARLARNDAERPFTGAAGRGIVP